MVETVVCYSFWLTDQHSAWARSLKMDSFCSIALRMSFAFRQISYTSGTGCIEIGLWLLALIEMWLLNDTV